MGYKIGLIAGAATGYVLGSRAGRSRYEQIKRESARLWGSEPVQSAVHTAVHSTGEAVKAKAPAATQGLVDKAVSAAAPGDQAGATDQTAPDAHGTTHLGSASGPAIS